MILCLGREANAVKRVKYLEIVLFVYCGQAKTLGKTKSILFQYGTIFF